MIRRLRILSQTVFFLVFLYLLARTQYSGADELRLPVKILLEIDPLHFLSTLLSSGTVPGLLWLALITVGLTLVFGRFFCGWICPLGALIQLAQKLPLRRRKARLVETNRWRPSQRIKFYVLAGLLVASLLGIQVTGLVDPLSLVIRSMALAVLPSIEMGLRAIFEAAYLHNPLGISDLTEPGYEWLQGRAINFVQPHFQQGFLFGLIFVLILALSFIRYRFWCRVVCPLGALLGVIARFGFFRVRQLEGCTECHRCLFDCQGAAEPEVRGEWRPSECVVCGNCTAACRQDGLAMGFAWPRLRAREITPSGRAATPGKAGASGSHTAAPDSASASDKTSSPAPGTFAGTQIHRRHVLISGLAGLAGAPLLRLGESRVRAHPHLIRPPGSLGEQEFLELCIRCGECMKVCLTNGLQPALFESGLEGLWTPKLVPRIGYCEYNCTLCGQVCPTQAIRRLEPEEKKKVRIGLAVIDTTRCLPYAFQQTCIVCEEHCPLPKKAIWFAEVEVVTHDGEKRKVKQPHVDLELCTGCGICETKCVVQDLPAIRITSANEDRNPDNRVLLQRVGAAVCKRPAEDGE
jgi:MauM/NapG family ferredoxin protein